MVQLQRKFWHEKHIKEITFYEGEWALLYDSRFKEFKGKLMTKWLGTYPVDKFHDNGFVQIRTIDDEKIPLMFNGYRLKFYKKPLSKAKFTKSIRRELNVIDILKAPNPFNT